MALESDQTEINRRQNARLLAAMAGSQARFAERISRTPGQVNHFIGKNPSKNIGKKLARHIEECFEKDAGWLDTNHFGDAEVTIRDYEAEAIHAEMEELSPEDFVELAEKFAQYSPLTDAQRLRIVRAFLPEREF